MRGKINNNSELLTAKGNCDKSRREGKEEEGNRKWIKHESDPVQNSHARISYTKKIIQLLRTRRN